MFEKPIVQVIEEMIGSNYYRALIWAGGHANHSPHSRSDVDLYAVSHNVFPDHWVGERVAERRVELTVYPLEQWQEILSRPYRHPKHHYTFAHGRVVYDPENLFPALSELGATVLASSWDAGPERIESLRNIVAISHDKTLGYREKNQPLHLRYLAIGCVHATCELLVTLWDGYAVDGGKNLTRVLNHPDCPASIKNSLTKLLSSPDTNGMADAANTLCQQCLEYSGGPLTSFRGGIPR